MTMDVRRRTERAAGMTLVELTVAMAITLMIFGSMGFAVTAFAGGANEISARFLADKETHRARKRLIEEIKTSDSVSVDEMGNPYFRVESVDGGTDNSIVLRRVEGYDIRSGDDVVSAVYGTEIRYVVDAEHRLVRQQDGQSEVIASRVKEAQFARTARGVVTVTLTFDSQEKGQHFETTHRLRIVPRNILSI